ncbi:hypothetical protein BG842_08150 [Haladaptatus sp. W1]|nr:hypothetical protein BG842_08150 [Haladaptatus sp. W1]GKZ13514.1 hypothetical protein HAL_13950 [Haladaptatus sp. T7]
MVIINEFSIIFKVLAHPCLTMAREPTLDTVLIGAVGAGAAALIGTRALEYYRERRRRSTPHVVCTDCGEAMPIDDVLDPAVTCACATSNVRMD